MSVKMPNLCAARTYMRKKPFRNILLILLTVVFLFNTFYISIPQAASADNGESAVLSKMGSFNPKLTSDVAMYYPIYKAVADKYGIDWYLLWIVHEAESGASDSVRAFNGGSAPYYGAMQRNVYIWSQNYVNTAASGLDSLASLPQRHPDDWKEIAAAGLMISTNIRDHSYLGPNGSVLTALLRYSAAGPAYFRFYKWEQYKQIFG